MSQNKFEKMVDQMVHSAPFDLSDVMKKIGNLLKITHSAATFEKTPLAKFKSRITGKNFGKIRSDLRSSSSYRKAISK